MAISERSTPAIRGSWTGIRQQRSRVRKYNGARNVAEPQELRIWVGKEAGALFIEQLADPHAKRESYFIDHGDGRVSRTAFKIADVCPVNTRLVRERFLGQAFGQSQAAQVDGQAFANIHAAEVAAWSSIGLQTISDIPLD